jgi:hypothetical protein
LITTSSIAVAGKDPGERIGCLEQLLDLDELGDIRRLVRTGCRGPRAGPERRGAQGSGRDEVPPVHVVSALRIAMVGHKVAPGQ